MIRFFHSTVRLLAERLSYTLAQWSSMVVPSATSFYITDFPSIHDTRFFPLLRELFAKLLAYASNAEFQFRIEAYIPSLHSPVTGFRTVGKSFRLYPDTNIEQLIALITEAVETFEAQSGSGDNEEYFTDSSRIVIYNNTNLTVPQRSLDEVYGAKAPVWAASRRAQKAAEVQTISYNVSQSVAQSNTQILDAIRESNTTITNVISNLGQSIIESNIQLINAIKPAVSTATPSVTQSEVIAQLKNELKAELMTEMNSRITQMETQISSLASGQERILALLTPLSSNENNNNGGDSTPPVTPTSSDPMGPPTPPTTPSSNALPAIAIREIEALKPIDTKDVGNFKNKIVAADLEALILPDGTNYVYMAAWFNGETRRIFDLTQFGFNQELFLQTFWLDLIQNNKGSYVYFHNWGGYDAILSLKALLNTAFNYTFYPVMKDGEIISLKVSLNNKVQITILDSIRILPSSLARLAKDWKVETMKSHFPHYFYLDSIEATLNYEGTIPAYTYFEIKRTSLAEYEEMVQLFLNKPWNFIKVSQAYILDDCKALFEILIKFFETIQSKFPINPLRILSAPSAAFRIWRTQQLPLLHGSGLAVYDLSYNLDPQLREGYCGGIVDVYTPHLQNTTGYYYDVNSLYPTAMCKPMPVGMPTPINLNINDFGEFFGYLKATVRAPVNEYIGLLPIKLGGRLICPGGTFTGVFFSEELRFALANGYQILNIEWALKFEIGNNCFKDLIEILNAMKIEGQVNKQPTIRNLAKLLMNSMYGRFGMKASFLVTQIVENTDRFQEAWDIISQIQMGNKFIVNMEPNFQYVLETQGEKVYEELMIKYGAHNTNVAIAGAVTAYSRMIINQIKLTALQLGATLYYSDTDSIVIDRELPQELISSTELGLMKLEHIITEGIFVMPKVYYLRTDSGEEVFKCKGYSGRLTREQYLELLEEESLNLTMNKWSRSMAQCLVRIERNTPYLLNYSFNKRIRYLDNGRYLTKPIILS